MRASAFATTTTASASGQEVAISDELTQFRPGGQLSGVVVRGLSEGAGRILVSSHAARTADQGGDAADAGIAGVVSFDSRSCPGRLREHDLATDRAGYAAGRSHALVGRHQGSAHGPFQTPWRTVLISETPGGLADSRMELNLERAEQARRHFVLCASWQVRGHLVGDALESLHLGQWPKHGATTANTKRYHRFRREAWLQRRAGRGLEHGGWRLDRQWREFQFHANLS